jgi:hypothetical protein
MGELDKQVKMMKVASRAYIKTASLTDLIRLRRLAEGRLIRVATMQQHGLYVVPGLIHEIQDREAVLAHEITARVLSARTRVA